MTSPTSSATSARVEPGAMTHRQVLEAMSGLVLAMFVAILSSTVVSNALPTIIRDLGGSQNQYTWVVAMTLLVSTASTPLWGKFADIANRKLLLQLGIVIFVLGSVLSGLSTSTEELIVFRGLQGLGLGGLQALTQIVLASMISPRERGRYSGYLGAAFALGTVSGPLIGGVLVDTSWLGWRWCFYVGVPFAVVALFVLQRTLRLPSFKRKVKIDYFGATFLVAGVSLLLVWSSLAGKSFAWDSMETVWFVGGGVASLIAAVIAESIVAEPVIPLRLFKNRTVTLATIASLALGVALFGSTVFLGQYFQVSRGYSPTEAGLLSFPLVLGLMVSSTISGQLISRSGKWKRYLVAGMVLVGVGFGLLGTIDRDTSLVRVGIYMAIAGIGVGLTLQNLILSVQNTVRVEDLGAASSTVTFFRSLGGAIGVSVLGSVLTNRVTDLVHDGLAALPLPPGAAAGASTSKLTDLASLPAPIRDVVTSAYGEATGTIFLVTLPLAIVALLAVLFIREIPLRTTVGNAPATNAPATNAPATIPAEPVLEVAAAGPVPPVEAPQLVPPPAPAVKPVDVLAEAHAAAEVHRLAAERLRSAAAEEVASLLELIEQVQGRLADHAAVLRAELTVSGADDDVPRGRHAAVGSVRRYEEDLLDHSERLANRVVTDARTDAQRMVEIARTEVNELNARIESLRAQERQLSAQVRERLVDSLEPSAEVTVDANASHR